MGKISRYGVNDRHALLEIAAGVLTADPTTGHVYRNKRIVGAARPDGYIAVNVRRINGKGYITVGAHRIVWMCHNAPIPVGMIVNHRNGMRWDNRLTNLDLTTATGNQRHARLIDYAAVGSGDDHEVDPQWWAQAKHLMALDAPYEEVAAITPSADDETNQAVYRHRPLSRPIYTRGY